LLRLFSKCAKDSLIGIFTQKPIFCLTSRDIKYVIKQIIILLNLIGQEVIVLLIYPKITIMDYRINFDEPISQMIQRLKQEHVDFESTFKKAEKCINENANKEAIKIIHDLSESIIKHAVEEEARLMRVIMQYAKEESADSIKIMQEHNWVVDFLKHKLQNIEGEINQQHSQQQQLQLEEKVKGEINEFIANLRNHFSEEEQIVFPLALKADSSYLNYK
jgi:hypothetical protein